MLMGLQYTVLKWPLGTFRSQHVSNKHHS